LIVSATTADVADVLDAKTGKIVSSFQTGHYPHQNDYSADGQHLYNGSIGSVGTPQAQEGAKGTRQLTVVDAKTFKVIKTYMFDHGIRPSVITPDEKFMYSQQSYLNGLIKYDLTAGKIVGMLDEPLSEFAMSTYHSYDEYPHDSAHHGLALSADGAWLCDAGTIDNTISIVSTSDLKVVKTLDTGSVPYWATTSVDGNYCFVSLSGDNAISIVDYKAQTEVTRVPVGKFPQRSRLGRIREASLALLAKTPG
jgi:DNA-binding beta-propeller fold protein YncE